MVILNLQELCYIFGIFLNDYYKNVECSLGFIGIVGVNTLSNFYAVFIQ